MTSYLFLCEDGAKALAYVAIVAAILITYIRLSLAATLARLANDQERLRLSVEQLQAFLRAEFGTDAPPAPQDAPPVPQEPEAPAPSAPTANGLPDGMKPAEARQQLMDELKALNVDDLRRKVRLLPTAEREAIREWVPRLEKARKDELITGLCRIVGL